MWLPPLVADLFVVQNKKTAKNEERQPFDFMEFMNLKSCKSLVVA